MSEQAIEAAALPIIEGALKALTPEAEAAVKAVEAHLVADAEHLKAEIDNSHNGIITWLRGALGAVAPATTVDPTPAVPAPQQ